MTQKEVRRLANALASAVVFSGATGRGLLVELSGNVRLIGQDGKTVARGPEEVARAILAIRKEAGDA